MDAGERWSANTRRAYAADWRDFERWAEARQVQVLPADPAVVELYLSEQATQRAWPTVVRRRAAIARAHLNQGLPDPTPSIRPSTLPSMRADPEHEALGGRRSAPLTVPLLVAAVQALPRTLRGERDRAVLLTAYAGAFRRSELVAIDVADLAGSAREGWVAPAAGRFVAIVRGRGRTCPARALQAWMSVAQFDDGALFRSVTRDGVPRQRLSASAVNTIVKDALRRIDVEPVAYSARSLRTGFVHAALAAGVPPDAVARHAGLPGASAGGGAAADPFTSRHLTAMGL